MPIYHRRGELPPKRHQIHPKADGGIHFEQLMGNKGFAGPSSLLYHLRPPTNVRELRLIREIPLEMTEEKVLSPRHFRTGRLPAAGSAVLDRVPLLFNDDVLISHARPEQEDEFYFRNGQADELVYVVEGSGTLESQFGELSFRSGDYVVIPRGILHRWRYAERGVRLLISEIRGDVRTPKHYRNEFGQLLEGAPFNERDIRPPDRLQVHDEEGEFHIVTKQHDALTEFVLGHHPLDAVGWDGYYYPWALSIHDFEPKVGRFHLPPPVHQTFESEGLVICSFCPRPYDFDPEAIPAPYFHSNVWSDEVLFYASSEFMSRKGIEFGSMTLHPDGLPHGPQPGRMEASIGVASTDELAVMIDTFRPLRVARLGHEIEDPDYRYSWKT
jgi:homogentisate 1,2-dioxygenase